MDRSGTVGVGRRRFKRTAADDHQVPADQLLALELHILKQALSHRTLKDAEDEEMLAEFRAFPPAVTLPDYCRLNGEFRKQFPGGIPSAQERLARKVSEEFTL